MTVQQLPSTTNFTVFYEDAIPNSQARAQSISSIADAELTVLNGWFGITNAFGPNDRINVYLDRGDGSGGNNFGYQSGGKSNTHIDVQSANKSKANADDIIRMIFINELCEIQMSYASGHGGPSWNAGDSAGEGLSQLIGLERFHRGHYLYYGSFVDAWLQSGARKDWVTASEGTDTNAQSFGCALLFLYYLKSQLGFNVGDIVRHGGSSLEATYKNLTGASGGFAAFNAVVSQFFPAGNTPAFNTFDNPFPLRGPGQRQVDLNWVSADDGSPRRLADGEADVKPFFFCPGGRYAFSIDSTPQVITCTATTRGFGQPVYSWRLNGVPIAPGDTVSVVAPVTTNDTADPQLTTSALETVSVGSDGTSTPFTSTLRLHVPAAVVGDVKLTVEASAGEKYIAPGLLTTEITWMTADNERVTWDDAYYKDRDECRRRWHDFIDRFSEFKAIDIVRTLPDPPPDYLRLVIELDAASRVFTLAQERAPEAAEQLQVALRDVFGLSVDGLQTVLAQFGKQ
jgi:hypothetical protein